MILEYKLPTLLELPGNEQVQGLKKIIEHFNYIETTIIAVGEQLWLTEMNDVKEDRDAERQACVLATSLQQWQKDGKVKILNYYKGLPVQAISKVMDVTGGRKPAISVQATSELGRVLAISDKQRVLAPDSEDSVFINMVALNTQGDSITFYIKGVSRMERRKHLRLQPLSKTAINIYRNKVHVGCGEVLDLSLSHIALSMPSADSSTFEKSEIVDIQFILNQDSLEGAGWIRSSRKDHDSIFICIEFMPDAGIQRQLQKETAIIQRKIIQEIRKKFAITPK
ncbi:MAG: hypothetical protein R8M38_00080 [Mariprofundaceae bacterium]